MSAYNKDKKCRKQNENTALVNKALGLLMPNIICKQSLIEIFYLCIITSVSKTLVKFVSGINFVTFINRLWSGAHVNSQKYLKRFLIHVVHLPKTASACFIPTSNCITWLASQQSSGVSVWKKNYCDAKAKREIEKNRNIFCSFYLKLMNSFVNAPLGFFYCRSCLSVRDIVAVLPNPVWRD